MDTRTLVVLAAPVALMASGAASGATLNFSNETGPGINQTVAESGAGEKEVDFGDFDNDGDLDVVVAVGFSDFGTNRNKLYRNDAGVFNEITGVPAIPAFMTPDVSRNAFFRDYNNDGWLDIIIVNDANTGGDGGRTKLYLNRQDGGEFDFFQEVGLTYLGASTGGAACGGVSVDVDNDDDPDLYVGNYPGPSQDTMYLDNLEAGDTGSFTAVTSTMVPGDGDYTVDVASGDMNGDGKLDLLISNWGTNKLYYNDNNEAGTQVGDFSYGGSVQNLGTAGANENSMEVADFNDDGMQDIYWSNRTGGGGDRILENTGLDGSNKALFSDLPASTLPSSVTSSISRKATVADLNDDGRVDLFVMKSSGRPTILRNTTVDGQTSFVDWTPATAFPAGSTHDGWHAAAFDTNGDDKLDVFLGGFNNDHLFVQNEGDEYLEADLVGGVIPGVYNGDAASVIGDPTDEGASDTYIVQGLSGSAFLSVVLNGPDDYLLEILDGSGSVLETIDRGGLGVEEAIQVSASSDRQIRVTIQESAGVTGDSIADIDGDGTVGPIDLAMLLGAWGPCPARGECPADLTGAGAVGATDLAILLGNWGDVVGPEYTLEVLARSG